MKKLTGIVWIALALGIAGPGAAVAHAGECGMGPDVDWYSAERAKVSQAEELLDSGHDRDAAWVVQTMWPRMREARPVESSLSHIADGVRVMALASIRSDGNVHPGLGWASSTPAERASNVRWGVERLRMLVAAHPESIVARTDLGEALARESSTQTEASAILEALDADHSVATPEGLHALARVRAAAGDLEGSAIAIAQCDAMTVAQDRCADDPEPAALSSSEP